MLLSPKSWSVGLQTFLVMLIVSLLLLWIGGGVLSKVAHTIQLQQIEDDVDKRTALFSTTLLDALLSEDIPVLETTLQGLVKIHSNLVGAEFCDYQDSPLLTWGEDPPHCDNRSPTQVSLQGTRLTTQRPVVFEGERFGTIVLRWELHQQIELLEQQVQQFVYTMVAAALFLAFVLFLLVQLLVVRPIGRIDQYLRSVETGKIIYAPENGFSSKEFTHLCEGVDILQKSMEAETQLHRELEELLASLEEQVADRTRDLQHSNHRLTSIMEHMGDGLFVVGLDGDIQVHNPAAVQLFPPLQSAHAISNFKQLFPDTVGDQVAQLLEGKDHLTETFLFSDQEMRQVSLEISVTPLVINMEEGTHLILVRDITKQRELEEKEQMIAFQSGIAEMSVSIMHNIGNILAGITGQVYVISKGGDELRQAMRVLEKLSDSMDQLPQETQRTALTRTQHLANELLEKKIELPLGRLEEGIKEISESIRLQGSNAKPIFQLSRFSPRSLLQDIIVLLEPNRKRHHIDIEIYADKDINEVYLPRNQLFQTLVNLVKNAIEAVAEQQPENGRIVITLSTKTENKVRGVFFSVKDNGVGVAPERINKLFSFGETSKQSGSGVGLHASGNFINSFGGKIGLESEGIGKGAESWIWLPLQ